MSEQERILAEAKRLAEDATPQEALEMLGTLEQVRVMLWSKVMAPVSLTGHGEIGSGAPLTVSEVAASFKVKEGRVYELVRQGQLRSFKIGKYVRIPRSAVEDYMTKNAVDTGLYKLYSDTREGEGAARRSKKARADAGSARRAVGRGTKHGSKMGAGRKPNLGAGSPLRFVTRKDG